MLSYSKKKVLHHHWKQRETTDVTIQFPVLSRQSSGILGIIWKELIPSFEHFQNYVSKNSQILMLY